MKELNVNELIVIGVFKETINQGSIDCGIIQSSIRSATPLDIQEELDRHKLGKCQHTIVKDDYGYPYDYRYCAICGKGLGTV